MFRARLDSLIPLWRSAVAAAASAERVRQRNTAAVVVEHAGLRFIVDSAAVEPVRAAAAKVWPMIDETFGSDGARLRDYPLIIERGWAHRTNDSIGILNVGRLRDGAPRWEYTASLADSASSVEQLVGILKVAAMRPLFDSLDAPMRRWLNHPLAAGVDTRARLEAAFLELVTWSVPIAQGCIAGDITSCRKVLGLTELTDPVVEALTARRRRQLVQNDSRILRVPGTTQEYDRCVNGQDDSACTRRLRSLPPDQLRAIAALSGSAQHSLLQFALARGGRDAHARLRTTTSLTLDARLAATSGMPTDSLVAEWRRSVMSARPSQVTVTPGTLVAAFLYTLGCGALAMRSSRWR